MRNAKVQAKEEKKQAKESLVRMYNPETKKYANVHPLEQLNYFRGGYRKVNDNGV